MSFFIIYIKLIDRLLILVDNMPPNLRHHVLVFCFYFSHAYLGHSSHLGQIS